MMTNYVLDSNIVTGLIKGDVKITARFDGILSDQNSFIGCPIVYFEVKRGLLEKNAVRQLRDLENLFSVFTWMEYTRADWELATSLWVKRRNMGRSIEDADLLIATFTINHNATLITNNVKDFDALGVTLADWSNL